MFLFIFFKNVLNIQDDGASSRQLTSESIRKKSMYYNCKHFVYLMLFSKLKRYRTHIQCNYPNQITEFWFFYLSFSVYKLRLLPTPDYYED